MTSKSSAPSPMPLDVSWTSMPLNDSTSMPRSDSSPPSDAWRGVVAAKMAKLSPALDQETREHFRGVFEWWAKAGIETERLRGEQAQRRDSAAEFEEELKDWAEQARLFKVQLDRRDRLRVEIEEQGVKMEKMRVAVAAKKEKEAKENDGKKEKADTPTGDQRQTMGRRALHRVHKLLTPTTNKSKKNDVSGAK